MSAQTYYHYYINQARGSTIQIGGGIDNYNLYYKGVRFQRPHTGRGWFSNLVSRVLPVLKSFGKSAGKSVLKGALDVGQDLLEGRRFEESVKERAQQRGKEIADTALNTVREQIGSGPLFNLSTVRKRKRASSVVKAPKIAKKKITDKVYLKFLSQLKRFKQQGIRAKKKKSQATRSKKLKKKVPPASKKQTKPKKSAKKKSSKKVNFEGLDNSS